MTALEIIDYARQHPDHPVSISPANWAALVKLFDSKDAEIEWWKNCNTLLEVEIERLEAAANRQPWWKRYWLKLMGAEVE